MLVRWWIPLQLQSWLAIFSTDYGGGDIGMDVFDVLASEVPCMSTDQCIGLNLRDEKWQDDADRRRRTNGGGSIEATVAHPARQRNRDSKTGSPCNSSPQNGDPTAAHCAGFRTRSVR
jgi:hypothetical protein